MASTTVRSRLILFVALAMAGFLMFSGSHSSKNNTSQAQETQSLQTEKASSMRLLKGKAKPTKEEPPTLKPTIAPTEATEATEKSYTITIQSPPTQEPSTVPAEARAISTDNKLYPLLPDYSFLFLEDDLSAQSMAYEWTTKHPELSTLDDWRILQLFAMSTLYYSLMKRDGLDIPEGESYLNYSLPECNWGATGFPGWSDVNASIVCDDNEERVQGISFQPGSTTVPKATNGFIPPEVSLLTSLEAVDITMAGINVTFQELLPAQMEGLANLTAFNFSNNGIHGMIPEEINVTLNGVQELDMEGNVLNGTIPTTIGLLGDVTYLSFGLNALTGTLPSELGLLQRLTSLKLFNNTLTGTIPIELSNLPNLTNLDLSGNSFDGSPPREVCDSIPDSPDCQESLPITPNPTKQPTAKPSARPTHRPTHHPTNEPTDHPTSRPSPAPTTNTFSENEELRAAILLAAVAGDDEDADVFREYGYPMDEWDVSRVTSFQFAFFQYDGPDFDISGWDTSKAKSFEGTFSETHFDPGKIKSWRTGSATTMKNMFANNPTFDQNIANFDTKKVTSFEGMFSGATAFSGDIGKWNVGRATTMTAMFEGATSFNSDISGWDVKSLTDISRILSGASSFQQDLCAWKDPFEGRDVAVSGAFENTACSFPFDPLQNTVNVGVWNGPFCYSCFFG